MLNFLNGFRKFTIMVLLIIVPTSLLVAGLLDSKDYGHILGLTGVAFMGSNSAEHMTKVVMEWLKTKKDRVLDKAKDIIK